MNTNTCGGGGGAANLIVLRLMTNSTTTYIASSTINFIGLPLVRMFEVSYTSDSKFFLQVNNSTCCKQQQVNSSNSESSVKYNLKIGIHLNLPNNVGALLVSGSESFKFKTQTFKPGNYSDMAISLDSKPNLLSCIPITFIFYSLLNNDALNNNDKMDHHEKHHEEQVGQSLHLWWPFHCKIYTTYNKSSNQQEFNTKNVEETLKHFLDNCFIICSLVYPDDDSDEEFDKTNVYSKHLESIFKASTILSENDVYINMR
jgi:hypothetical protein